MRGDALPGRGRMDIEHVDLVAGLRARQSRPASRQVATRVNCLAELAAESLGVVGERGPGLAAAPRCSRRRSIRRSPRGRSPRATARRPAETAAAELGMRLRAHGASALLSSPLPLAGEVDRRSDSEGGREGVLCAKMCQAAFPLPTPPPQAGEGVGHALPRAPARVLIARSPRWCRPWSPSARRPWRRARRGCGRIL